MVDQSGMSALTERGAIDAAVAKLQEDRRRLRITLEEIAVACETRAHPAAPVLITELHVADMCGIAAKARAVLDTL